MTDLEGSIIAAAILSVPPACFWIAWELRGIRERVGGIQSAVIATGRTAQSAMVRADVANRRLDVLERLAHANPAIINFKGKSQ